MDTRIRNGIRKHRVSIMPGIGGLTNKREYVLYVGSANSVTVGEIERSISFFK
jgi:hypothetical protein